MKTALWVRVMCWTGALAVTAILAPAARAQSTDAPGDKVRTDVRLSVGAVRSDNLQRAPANEVNGTIWSAGLGLDIARQGRRLDLSVRGALDWMAYPDDTFDTAVLGDLDALAAFAFVPEVFVWRFQETYGQVRVSPVLAVTPGNLEDISYFSTGPELTLRTGNATSVRLAGRYSRTDSGVDLLEGEQYRAEAALMYSLNQASSLSLQGATERFEFAGQPASAEFKRNEAYAHYELRGARSQIGADLGYTALDMDSGTSDGVLARLSVSRRLSPAAQLQLILGKQFSSAADLLRGGLQQPDFVSDPGAVLGNADPFENRSAELRWDFNRNRTGLGLALERREELHENSVLFDRKRTSFNAYMTRRMTRKLSVRADARLADESFESGFDSKELQLGARLTWMAGRKLDLTFGYDRVDRNSSLAAQEFVENRISLFAVWSPLARR